MGGENNDKVFETGGDDFWDGGGDTGESSMWLFVGTMIYSLIVFIVLICLLRMKKKSKKKKEKLLEKAKLGEKGEDALRVVEEKKRNNTNNETDSEDSNEAVIIASMWATLHDVLETIGRKENILASFQNKETDESDRYSAVDEKIDEEVLGNVKRSILVEAIDQLLFDVDEPDPAIEKFLMEFDEIYFEPDDPSPFDLGYYKKKHAHDRERQDHETCLEDDDLDPDEEKKEKRKRQKREVRRFFKLAAPLTLGGLHEYFIEIVFLIMVGNLLGEESLNAYIAVGFLCDLSVIFAEGLADAQYTLVAHAVGARNAYLAGQLMQLSMVFDFLYYVIVLCLLFPSMPDILSWFGYSERTIALGSLYFNVVAISMAMDSVLEKVTFIFDVIDKAKFKTALNMTGDTSLCLTTFVFLYFYDYGLYAIAWIELAHVIVFNFLMLYISKEKGWLDPYIVGMTDNVVMFTNGKLSYKLLKNSGILSLGYILYHSEWEILTFMAMSKGVDSLTAWLILGSIWGLLEEMTHGMGEAAEIRVAYHLGRGDFKMARTSGFLCIFIGTVVSVIQGAILLYYGESLINLIALSEDVDAIAVTVIPFIAVGNFVLVYGMVCSNLIEAQGRFRLATMASAVTIFGLTLPLAYLFLYTFDFGLCSLASALVVGYSTSGAVLAYFLLQSDWKKYSDKIRRKNRAYDDEEEENNVPLEVQSPDGEHAVA